MGEKLRYRSGYLASQVYIVVLLDALDDALRNVAALLIGMIVYAFHVE
jgi:hypothetical protein